MLTSILYAPYAPGASHLTTIAYDDANATRTVTSPFGNVTTLALDGSGNLSTLSRSGGPPSAPTVETYTVAATADGLLTSFSDPNGTILSQAHQLIYDTTSSQPTGRVTSAQLTGTLLDTEVATAGDDLQNLVYPGFTCKEVVDVDEDCVTARLNGDINQHRGPWFPGNDCQSYVNEVLYSCGIGLSGLGGSDF